MATYILRRLVISIPVLLGVSFLVFSLIHITPGDPAALMLGLEAATDEQLAMARHQLGLDRPFFVQYADFLSGALRGDFGNSIQQRRPVADVVLERFPATIELALASMLFALVVAIPLGVISAIKQYSAVDNASMFVALLGISMPNFWLGLLLMLLFSVQLGWLPASGRGGPLLSNLLLSIWYLDPGPLWQSMERLLLPMITLGTGVAALLTRLTRSAMLEVIRQDYIRTARSKGLADRVVIYRHALRNAMMPVVTMTGLYFGGLLGGSVITETIFAWPGVGRMAIQAIYQRDFPVVQAVVLMLAVIFVLVNLLVDVVYAVIDPRIRYD